MTEENEATTEEKPAEIVQSDTNGAAPPSKESDASPMGMIETAIENDADINVLERLFDLQERQEKNEAKRAFDAAIADLQDDLPEIVKNREVSFETKKGKTEYQYEDLGSIVEAIKEPMSEHGLSHRWNTDQAENGRVVVTCILSHRLGHSEETSVPAPKDTSGGKNAIQSIGSTITYLQRYTLKAALGLAASYDDDGQAAGRSNGSSNSGGGSTNGSDLTTDPDERELPPWDSFEDEWNVVADLPNDELVNLKDYLTGDKLEGKYAHERKTLRKTVLKEIKRRKEESGKTSETSSESTSDRITDAALELARANGVTDPELNELKGSGEDGRIIKSDVQEHLEDSADDSDEEDSDDGPSLNDAMNTIMQDCSDLIDDTPATISEIRATVEERGVTQDTVDRVINHLADVQDGDAVYETQDGVIQFK